MYKETLEIETKKGIHIEDITPKITAIVKKSEISEGMCNIFLQSTTSGLFVNEFDMMLFEDIKKFFKDIVDEKKIYHHPSNASSHLRAMLLKPEISIPVHEGELMLGTWQRILLIEFDVVPRKRNLIVTIIEFE
ncbi:MAG: secondary thiamine-phosphate synthase enzyme YjbQ [Candidatus Aenigmatarchaeota archaeon]